MTPNAVELPVILVEDRPINTGELMRAPNFLLVQKDVHLDYWKDDFGFPVGPLRPDKSTALGCFLVDSGRVGFGWLHTVSFHHGWRRWCTTREHSHIGGPARWAPHLHFGAAVAEFETVVAVHTLPMLHEPGVA